ncbi:MAG: rhodanese-like domain-containing protein [Proteobacteria bacterium]|nr:rhodanese-like domain-containing protein [Pseudomonadota bacterium]
MISFLRFWLGLTLLAATTVAGAQGADAVTVQEAQALLAQGGAVLIDVREPKEHLSGVAPGARLLPMSQLESRWREVPSDPATPVLLICRTQNRSQAVLNQLRAKGGYAHLRYVQGGMNEWAMQGGPLVAPASAVPPASAAR